MEIRDARIAQQINEVLGDRHETSGPQLGEAVSASAASGAGRDGIAAEMKMQAGYMAARLNGIIAGASPILREGSLGTYVSDLQSKLAELGFSPGPIDGIFGPKTKAAVIAYQRSRGLIVDGICGPQTRRALAAESAPAGSIPQTGNAFIDSIADDAMRTQREMGIPASVTIAQAILESGWGKSGLTRVANNYFGIKGTGPAGYVVMPTSEYINGRWITVNSRFRKYHNAEESFTDHARFFLENRNYAEALKHIDDPFRFAREIQRAGYATAPNYSNALISIMRQYGLVMFDSYARNL